MNILGISGGFMHGSQDAAAALLIDGKLVFAQEEERLSRQKHAIGTLPAQAMQASLAHADLSMNDIDLLAFHTQWEGLEGRIRDFVVHVFGVCPEIRFVNHHLAHAASAYYASDFEDAMILTADLSGDGISTTLAHGVDNQIKTLKSFPKPQSLGIYYSIITQLLGFRRDNDEYKVMGMGAYGKPDVDLSWLLNIEHGHYSLNEDYIVKITPNQANRSKQEPMYSSLFAEKIGFRRINGEPFEAKHYDLAASAQAHLNEAAKSMIEWLHEETKSRHLVVAGGLGLNCVMNQALLAMDVVDHIFVQPASSDAGTALGAAYEVAIQEGESLARFPGAHIGNEFTADQIRREIENIGVDYQEVANPAEAAAEAVAQGKIVGWFQGRHEFGPRALGGRSILADPRREDMKDQINIRVKFREEFRPFAPSVLEEHADRYFDSGGHSFPYMTVTNNVNMDKRESLLAVAHEDNTSRIQTVSKDALPLYHELIDNFYELTGVPVVVNTSFNVKGQPVVNTPTHAVGTLFGSGMDAAFIGPFVVDKKHLS